MQWLALMLFVPVTPITAQSVLMEANQPHRLARPAAYVYDQASSYDRASTKPGDESWFANADAGKYLRTDQVAGRAEHVMLDAQGPGAVQRVWSANPSGTVRFYFDGETRPRIEMPFDRFFIDGITAPSSGLGYISGRGYNLYAPILYSKSLKVTLEGDNATSVYYQIGYRTYPAETAVRTYEAEVDKPVFDAFQYAPNDPRDWVPFQTKGKQSVAIEDPDGGTVSELEFQLQKSKGTWRDANITVSVDGETTIATTIGDLFACPAGARPFESVAMSIQNVKTEDDPSVESATFRLSLPQPFARSFRVEVDGDAVQGEIVASHLPSRERPPFRLFSQTRYFEGSTRPFADMTAVDTTGRGRFVGLLLSVQNPQQAWWGEGDEKIWVDDDAFPSVFGTGTEDYFGYAWCDVAIHAKPFHGQPRADGPGNFGQVSNYRWQTYDDIPFHKRLKFDLEKWHWGVTDTSFATTAFWYGEPGRGNVTRESPTPVRDLLAGISVPGALEGESMAVAKTGGTTEVQTGFGPLSNFGQLWWKDPSPGDRLSLTFVVPSAGRYKVEGHFCHAFDYGQHALQINGKASGTFDFYDSSLTWRIVDLGIHDLTSGEAQLTVTCQGNNTAADPRRMFGLDYLKLTPVADP